MCRCFLGTLLARWGEQVTETTLTLKILQATVEDSMYKIFNSCADLVTRVKLPPYIFVYIFVYARGVRAHCISNAGLIKTLHSLGNLSFP